MSLTTLARRLALVAAPVAAALALSAAPAGAASGSDHLLPKETLKEGQYLVSGSYTLKMQTDGNFVLYSGSKACWSTHTNNGSDETHAYMEPGGDFAIFANAHTDQLWHTNTSGSLMVVVQKSSKSVIMETTTGDIEGQPKALSGAHC